MTVVAVAFCPHPPLLVPDVAAGAAGELDDLRAACDAAVATMLATEPEVVLVLGTGPETSAYSSADSGSLRPYGVDVVIPLGPRVCAGRPILPLSLTIGAWLLQRTGWTGDRQGFAVGPGANPEQLADEVQALGDRVGVLCLGDGTAKRTEKAPGFVDERAEEVDAALAAALGAGVPPALDHVLADELMVAGKAAWDVVGSLPGPWRGELLHDSAPYGVGYVVATWVRA